MNGGMLHEFLTANREEILVRARKGGGATSAPEPTELELTDGLPLFLDQLGSALLLVAAGGAVADDSFSKPTGTHGAARSGKGFTVTHAVRDYRELCRAVTDLAMERDATITVEECVTLDRCLDHAIACAITERRGA